MNKMIISNRYKFIEKIGEGSFGRIYKCINIITKKEVAVKIVDKNDTKKSKIEIILLKNEAKMYNYFKYNKLRYQIKFRQYGSKKYYNYLVLDLLTKSFDKWNNDRIASFNSNEIELFKVIFHQITCSITELHNCGYLHRDIKPSNFLLKYDETQDYNYKTIRIYLIDFGISKSYINDLGKHVKMEQEEETSGNYFYRSIHNHNKWKHSRRDDLLSIGYMMFFYIYGNFLYDINEKELVILKKNCYYNLFPTLSKLITCGKINDMIYKYFNYCNQLSFDEKPDYEYLKNIFLK